LYGDEEYLELSCIFKIIYDCLFYSIKTFNSNLNLSNYAKQTLNSILNSLTNDANQTYLQEQDYKNKILKDDLKIWVLTEFPELFSGYHNWIISRIKELKPMTEASDDQIVNDLSDFMNTTMTWFLVCNLPIPYVKSLEIENASLTEKLKNGLVCKLFINNYFII
jgi:hypothetical protein